MTSNNREQKLPKWAQDLLEDVREEAALRWPGEPEPEPAFRTGTDDYTFPSDLRGKVLWKSLGGHTPAIQSCTVTEHGYESKRLGDAKSGFYTRPSGTYYFTERDALLALRWKVSAIAARRLRLIDRLIDMHDEENSGGST